MMPRYPLIYVRYYDHSTTEDAYTKEVETSTPLVLDEVGWLIRETKQCLYLAQTITSESKYNYSEIMKSCIIERRKLK